MTTQAAENLYLDQHLHKVDGKKYAYYNPHDKPLNELPFIYGFNNGGSHGWFSGVLLSEDGVQLGGHTCSHEGYMRNDLGILEGSRLDHHENFKKHYPDGYRMDFVSYDDFLDHKELNAAFLLNDGHRRLSNAKHDESSKT